MSYTKRHYEEMRESGRFIAKPCPECKGEGCDICNFTGDEQEEKEPLSEQDKKDRDAESRSEEERENRI